MVEDEMEKVKDMVTGNYQNKCQQCGKCCYFNIPITLFDIHKIAQIRLIDDTELLRKNI